MRKTGMILLGFLLAVSLCACDSDDGDSSGPAAGVAGTWNGTGNYVFNSVPITQFTLNLAQTGNAVSGTYAIKRDARDLMTGTVSGSVGGGRISMTLAPHGSADGSVGGDTMTLDWVESGFGGAAFTGPRNASVTLTR